FQPAVAGARGADIEAIAQAHDAWICKAFAYLGSGLLRGIINDDDLEVTKGLVETGAQCDRQCRVAVVGRDDDREHHGRDPPRGIATFLRPTSRKAVSMASCTTAIATSAMTRSTSKARVARSPVVAVAAAMPTIAMRRKRRVAFRKTTSDQLLRTSRLTNPHPATRGPMSLNLANRCRSISGQSAAIAPPQKAVAATIRPIPASVSQRAVARSPASTSPAMRGWATRCQAEPMSCSGAQRMRPASIRPT